MTVLLAEDRNTGSVRHLGRAFGLDLVVGFRCPGLPAPAGHAARGPGPTVRLDIVGRRDLPRMPIDAERLWEARRHDGRVAVRLTSAPTAGYRFSAVGYGEFHIDDRAAWVGCSPVRGAAWRWQRFLVGQILPFLAVVHGYEVFHASAVRLGVRTVAFTGASRGGKSSLAIGLVLRGARLITDDVMVLAGDSAQGALRVHPGFGLASVRHDTVESLGSAAIGALGRRLGSDDDAVRVLVELDADPPPVTDVFFLNRVPTGTAPLIETIHRVDPRLLLAAGYNYVIRTRERLVHHLDVCARLASTATLYRLAIPPHLGAAEVAAAVRAHLSSAASGI
jgi:hypothetical protein